MASVERFGESVAWVPCAGSTDPDAPTQEQVSGILQQISGLSPAVDLQGSVSDAPASSYNQHQNTSHQVRLRMYSLSSCTSALICLPTSCSDRRSTEVLHASDRFLRNEHEQKPANTSGHTTTKLRLRQQHRTPCYRSSND
jgi:hypothetical protein